MIKRLLIYPLLVLALAGAAAAAVSVTPASDSLDPGETTPQVTVGLTFPPTSSAGTGTVSIVLPGALAGSATVLPSATRSYSFPMDGTSATVTFRIRTTGGAPAGTYVIVATDNTNAAGSAAFSLTVRSSAPPPPPPAFSFTIRPATVRLTVGEGPVPLTVTTIATSLTTPIAYSVAGLPAFILSDSPQSALPPAFAPRVFTLSAAAGATPGTYGGVVRGTAAGLPARTVPLRVIVEPPTPVLTAVQPLRLTAGQPTATLSLSGRFFEPGASVAASDPRLRILNVDVTSPSSATLRVSVAPSRERLGVELVLRNPSGRASAPRSIVIEPATALDAPFVLRSVAVTHPRPGRQMGQENRVFPLGVVVAAGSGLVSGSWLLDGVVFDRFTGHVTAGLPLRVAARVPIPRSYRGPHRLELRVETPAALSSPPLLVLTTIAGETALRTLTPEDGAAAGGLEAPVLRWTLVPGARGYRVEIQAGDETLRRETVDTLLELSRPLAAGVYRWRVRALFVGGGAGQPTPWSTFQVGSTESATRSPLDVRLASQVDEDPFVDGDDSEEAANGYGDFQASLELSDHFADGDEQESTQMATAAVSLSANRFGAGGELQATGDASWSDELEGLAQDSESWLLDGSVGNGGWKAAARAGYSGPSSLAQLELLGAGFARGGGEVSIARSGLFEVSGYSSFDPELGSTASGSFGGEQDLTAASITVGSSTGRAHLALDSLSVDAAGNEWEEGGKGDGVGLSGHFDLGSWTVRFEAARGEFEPEGGLEPATEGDALRLDISRRGESGSLTLRLADVEGGFVNPANRGLSVGGQPDRRTIELESSRWGQKWNWDATLTQVQGEEGSERNPTARLAGTTFTFTPSPKLRAAFEGNWSVTEAEADPVFFIPASEIEETRFGLTLTETLGPVEISESFSRQDLEDAFDPLVKAQTDERSLALSVAGSGGFSLYSMLNLTEVEDGQSGTTDTLLLSLQPAWTIAGPGLTFSVYASYLDTENEFLGFASTTEQYQTRVAWAPSWFDSLLNLELSSDWSRTGDGFSDGEFVVSYLAALTLSWGVQRPRQDGWDNEGSTSDYLPAVAPRRRASSLEPRITAR